MRKQYARNKLFNLWMVLGLIFAGISIDSFGSNDLDLAVIFGVFALLFMIATPLLTPAYDTFDVEGVSLHYMFYPTERYLWKDIYAIEVEYRYTRHAPFYSAVFTIYGKTAGPCRAYMNGHIRRSLRTKHLLEKYWDGTITGYLLEDAKKWMQQRRNKKAEQVQAHLTDEIVPMEREIRACAREWLHPFVERAKQLDITLKTEYLYITGDDDESKSRPQKGYTYSLAVEISRLNETNENRIYIAKIDLLYVRLGKTAYRGVKNTYAQEELCLALTDGLEAISKFNT